ncbi:alpha/beta fold hydrolase [Nocardia salmonicida]|uniref:alpha/beta fold hydrolase n=2 Tax=Nocardia salmonicida TaxID=53431 RepID=UPI002E296C70|nr:alpha/beta hydrolase [Nocardia salmonicida]
MPFVTSGGVRIHYTDTGGDGRVVVLGHSLFMDQEMFAPQVRALTPDYRLIAIDSRGHGPSEDPGTPFSYWDLARDAWAVVDALGLEHVVVGGVAHGGFTALRMALLAHSRVDGLIVIGSTAAAMPARRKVGYREVFDAWTGDVPLAPTVKMVSSLMIGAGAEDQKPWRDKWLASDRVRARLAGECLVNRDSVLELLGDIECPALVIRGMADQANDAGEMDEMARALGRPTEVHTIAGASLTPNLTHPDEVNPLLRSFLDGLPERSLLRS